MTTLDPYAAPGAPGGGGVSSPDVPLGAVEALRGTRPWVLLFSILGFLFTALLVLGGLASLLGGGAMFVSEPGATAGPAGMMVGLALVYLLMGLLYLLPSLYLYRYASRIAHLGEGGGATALVDALEQQRRFWRLAGIVVLVGVVVYGLIVVVAIVVGGLGAFGS